MNEYVFEMTMDMSNKDYIDMMRDMKRASKKINECLNDLRESEEVNYEVQ